MAGFVSLVGAGPGDPDLVTRRGLERLQTADVVYHDGLVPSALVALAGSARRISVARRAGRKALTQSAVTRQLIASARAGHRVVRLKCGDPFVFGRGGEEADALTRARIPFDVVPGVTTATAAPALAGIALTRRGLASAVVVVTGHDTKAFAPIVARIAPDSATLVILMGLARRAAIVGHLKRAGWRSETPATLVLNASLPSQRVLRRTLATLSRPFPHARRDAGVIVIGRAAGRIHGSIR